MQFADTTPTLSDPNWITADTTTAPEGTNTLYFYSVDTAGNSESIKSRVFKVDTTPPTWDTPWSIRVAGIGGVTSPSPEGGQVMVGWNGASDINGVSYRVYYALDGTFNWGTSPYILISPTDPGVVSPGLNAQYEYVLSGLIPGANYTFGVRAQDGNGNLTTNTETLTGVNTTAETIPPTAPILSSFAASTTSLNLYWTSSTDNIGVTGYRIYDTSNAVLATTAATAYSLTGLTPGQTYGYYVKAFDGAGNASAPSNTIAITLPTSPGATGETPAGSGVESVTVSPTQNVSLTFGDITSSGTTTVTQATGNIPGPPSGFRFRGQVLDINTTAGYTPPVTIAIKYDEADIRGNEASLKLFHYEQDPNTGNWSWVDRTLYVDTVNNIIYGQVWSFSLFGLGGPSTPPTGMNTNILIIISLISIGSGIFMTRKPQIRYLQSR